MNTHGVIITFGKFKDELLTRVPLSYLRYMINNDTPQVDYAKAEFKRRGDTMPVFELSGHAIDNASLRVTKRWYITRKNDKEGLFSWLQRMTLEAIENGERLESGKIKYKGIKFVIEEGEEFPVLITIMR